MRVVTLSIVAGAALAFAACGGGGDETPPAPAFEWADDAPVAPEVDAEEARAAVYRYLAFVEIGGCVIPEGGSGTGCPPGTRRVAVGYDVPRRAHGSVILRAWHDGLQGRKVTLFLLGEGPDGLRVTASEPLDAEDGGAIE